MAIKDLVQRSDEWFEWRKTGVTASMIPVILGLSPYQTPYQLWAELCGLKKPDDLSKNYHVQRGVEQEPEARDEVENIYGKPYMPVCVEADHNELFKASLDGLYKGVDGAKEVLEIKCPHAKIYNEIISEQANAPTFKMYHAQVQWQLNCAGAETARLFFYLRGNRPINVGIPRDDGLIKQAEDKALWFWNLVQTKTPPPLIDGRDKVTYHLETAMPLLTEKANQYKEKRNEVSKLEDEMKAKKSELKAMESYFIEMIPDDSQTFDFQGEGIRATRVDRTGSINAKKLIELIKDELDVTLPESLIEKAKGKDTTHYKVSITEESTEPSEAKAEDAGSIAPTEVENPVEAKEQHIEAKQHPIQQSSDQDCCIETNENDEINGNSEIIPMQPLPPSHFFDKSATSMYF